MKKRHFLRWAAVLAALTLTLPLHAQSLPVFPFESGPFIRQWLLLGPFPAHGNASIYKDYLAAGGGEDHLRPAAGQHFPSAAVANGSVTWRPAMAGEDGKLDLRKHLSPNQNDVAYAAVTVRCKEQTPALLLLGSNDMMALWLNGKRVYVHPDPRASGPDADKIAVTLNKGDNLLLAKVQNVGGGWWLYTRFTALHDLDGTVYITDPMVSPVPRRTGRGEIADIFSVLLYNASGRPAGPVIMTKDDDDEVIATVKTIPPAATVWMRGVAPIPHSGYPESYETTLTLRSDENSRAFRLTVRHALQADGTTWFVQGFHVDPVWRDSQAGYQVLSFKNFSQFLWSAQGDSGFRFVASEIPYVKPYYDAFPRNRHLIRKMVQQGHLATCGSYNQPNETTISGEALIRNILYGRLFHEKVLGDYPRVYQPWDVFGHIIQLPQILAKAEFTGTVWERGNYRSPSVRVPGVPDLYLAMAPDGTVLPARKVSYGFRMADGGAASEAEMVTRTRIAKDMQEQQQQIPGIRYDFRLNAIDEKAPTAWMVGRSDIFPTFIPQVSVNPHGAGEYFDHVLEQKKQDGLDIPLVSRDVSQYNEGCELSRNDLKTGNRLGENTLITAEKFSVFAGLLGMPYPQEALDKAWRQLLYGQHHDGITGCGADEPFLDLMSGYHEALALAGNSLDAALDYLGTKINTAAGPSHALALTVFNPLNWTRTDVVHTTLHFDKPVKGFRLTGADNKTVPVTTEHLEKNRKGITAATITFLADSVPSMGYRTWWIVPAKNVPAGEKEITPEEYEIKNDFFRITADKKMGGGITGIIDRHTLKQYINTRNGHPANELILLKEGSGFEPAWRFLTTGEKYFSKDYPADIHIFRSPLYERMVITGKMPGMKKRVQEVILYRGLDRIDFRTYLVDYKGMGGKNIPENDTTPLKDQRDLYVVAFPPSLKGTVPVLEDRFATKVYFRGKDPFSYNSTSTEWTTHHSMNSCYQWFDQSWSVKINFGGRYSVAPGPAEIITPRDTLLRQAGFRLERALAQRGITATPAYPDVKRGYDMQYRRFCFSAGAMGKNRYNDSLLAAMEERGKRAVESQIRQKGYAYAFIYDRHVPGAWFDYPVLMILGRDERNTLRGMDQLIRQLEKDNTVTLPLEAYLADSTHWVEERGLGLINRGNIAVGTEPDGTMVLALMHTVPWQSPLLPWTHDFPERKTHVFDYALRPHRGNWQEAGMVRSGYEYNNPLIARTFSQHAGSLPPAHSFLGTGDSHCVISAVKPVTTGIAALAGKKPDSPAQGIIIRLYEPEGKEENVSLTTSFPLDRVQEVNLLERKGKSLDHDSHRFSVKLPPYAIETFLVNTAVKASGQGGYHPAPDHPVYVRYWEHNEGAAPAGYMPVNIHIVAPEGYDKKASHSNIRQVTVYVTNDDTGMPVRGTVTMEAPPGIRMVPEHFSYEVPANSERAYPVTLVPGDEVTPGFLRASLTHDSLTLFDAVAFRLPPKQFGHAASSSEGARLAWDVSADSSRVVITLNNPFAQQIDGTVTLIGPVESWGESPYNPYGTLSVRPWQRSFSLPPNSTKTLYFDIRRQQRGKDNAFWLVAKLAWFGYLDYKPAWPAGKRWWNDSYDNNVKYFPMKERQITFSAQNHDLDNNDNFSPGDRFLCYDTRGTVYNDDIGNCQTIGKVEIATGRETLLYRPDSIITGERAAPGVGAVSYHPTDDKVIFIHGPLAEEVKERGYYAKPNRTAMAVAADGSGRHQWVDMRDVTDDPTPAGAHRGGTHRHEYSRDGNRIGFTYDDYLVRDIDRTIGFMQPDKNAPQGYSHYFAVILKPAPKGKSRPGEIEKAFGDAWVDDAGTMRAFIGKVRRDDGRGYDEDLFVAVIPQDLDIHTAFAGTRSRYPEPPEGITIRRLTHGMHVTGIVRGSYDGTRIAFAAGDDRGIAQLFVIRADGSETTPHQLTHLDKPVEALRWHPSDKWIFFISGGNIFAATADEEGTPEVLQLTRDDKQREHLVLSHDGTLAAYDIRTPTRDAGSHIVKDATGKDYRQVWVMEIRDLRLKNRE